MHSGRLHNKTLDVGAILAGLVTPVADVDPLGCEGGSDAETIFIKLKCDCEL